MMGGKLPGVTGQRHTRECSECRKPTPSDQGVTCSARCRKRRERRIKDQQSAWILALHEIGKMRDSIKRKECETKTMREQLIRIRDEINDLLLMVNDADMVARREMLSEYRRNRF